MTDPTSLRLPVSTSSRVGGDPAATPDDGTMLRLAVWLVEVSVEAARDAAATPTLTLVSPRDVGPTELPVKAMLR